MNEYYYIDKETRCPLMIYAKKKPSLRTEPKSGAWVIREYHDGWHIPCFPEITWYVINKKLLYVGVIKNAI